MNPTLEIKEIIDVNGIGTFVAASIFSGDRNAEVADYSFLQGNAIDYVLQSPVGENRRRHNIYMFKMKDPIGQSGLVVSQLVELS